MMESKELVNFRFHYKYEEFVARLWDDGTWEVTNVEGDDVYLVQQGVWNVDALPERLRPLSVVPRTTKEAEK